MSAEVQLFILIFDVFGYLHRTMKFQLEKSVLQCNLEIHMTSRFAQMQIVIECFKYLLCYQKYSDTRITILQCDADWTTQKQQAHVLAQNL